MHTHQQNDAHALSLSISRCYGNGMYYNAMLFTVSDFVKCVFAQCMTASEAEMEREMEREKPGMSYEMHLAYYIMEQCFMNTNAESQDELC